MEIWSRTNSPQVKSPDAILARGAGDAGNRIPDAGSRTASCESQGSAVNAQSGDNKKGRTDSPHRLPIMRSSFPRFPGFFKLLERITHKVAQPPCSTLSQPESQVFFQFGGTATMQPKNLNSEDDKLGELEQVENLSPSQEFVHQGWRASTPHEAALDRSVNLKMDCTVVFILTAGFLVRNLFVSYN